MGKLANARSLVLQKRNSSMKRKPFTRHSLFTKSFLPQKIHHFQSIFNIFLGYSECWVIETYQQMADFQCSIAFYWCNLPVISFIACFLSESVIFISTGSVSTRPTCKSFDALWYVFITKKFYHVIIIISTVITLSSSMWSLKRSLSAQFTYLSNFLPLQSFSFS